ncbi:hypothetical protein BDC45DRAFT_566212 [Circinella umbellata]|nr:hypothetical protein BDC45DRAFT_566212 [Circinella umbellata]
MSIDSTNINDSLDDPEFLFVIAFSILKFTTSTTTIESHTNIQAPKKDESYLEQEDLDTANDWNYEDFDDPMSGLMMMMMMMMMIVPVEVEIPGCDICENCCHLYLGDDESATCPDQLQEMLKYRSKRIDDRPTRKGVLDGNYYRSIHESLFISPLDIAMGLFSDGFNAFKRRSYIVTLVIWP